MQHFKMSTSRDFRINAASLQAAMEQAAAADDTDDNDGDEDNDEQVITVITVSLSVGLNVLHITASFCVRYQYCCYQVLFLQKCRV